MPFWDNLLEAADKVHRAKHWELKQEGKNQLTGLRQLLLYNEEDHFEVRTIQRAGPKTGRAWAIKETLWNYSTCGRAQRLFNRWYA